MERPFTSNDRYRADTRKQQIVETVLKLVASHGTEAMSAQLVADAIGVTQPAVFRHFPTKEAIWLAVMDWLDQQLAAIHSASDDFDEPALTTLSRMFLDHVRLIERYPALAKLVLSDHLRVQYPAVQHRFGGVHRAYMARLSAILDRARSEGAVLRKTASRDAATMFLALIQGLGFQFAIARLPMKLQPEAERILAVYLQGIAAAGDATAFAARTIEAAKSRRTHPRGSRAG